VKEQTREDPTILAAAERQMHAWALQTELKDRAIPPKLAGGPPRQAVRFVAISREAGAGGSEIAEHVGQRLGWSVFDKNLLDQIATRFHLPRTTLDLVDETPNNWAYDVLGTWMDRKLVPHEKYVACLSRVVLMAGRRGRAVFVGRGAQFLLPRQEVLAVRCIASPKLRLERIVERTGLDKTAAQRRMSEIDRGRRQFVERFFHHDSTDSHLYDLVINIDRFGTSGAAAAIVAAMGQQGPIAITFPSPFGRGLG
jgi:hypothetical protein